MKRRKPMGNGIYKNVIAGTVVGILTVIVGALTAAYMIHKEWMATESLGYISVVIILAAGFMATAIGGRGMAGRMRLLWGAVTGGAMVLLMACCNIALFEGQFSGFLVTSLLVLGCAICSFLLFGKITPRNKFKIPKL